ncbi:hypothetical protein [Rhizobium bangladeshense]|uniref:hypothetical protein n=1 Tax=Rhizobium bangladeshense TaxID=1138189 RepID=UPI001A9A17F0|nr:hypothetical protein [Rhizobium bangladeshense]MBX4932218.1 hypothetical protein [Rhizobium bangladeshense]MBY3585188.1 hypothetical protein [Rhizobium bangladeshense]QSY89481.1 hypothetical protein J2J98_04850 [Rhizobium bangladeshense]
MVILDLSLKEIRPLSLPETEKARGLLTYDRRYLVEVARIRRRKVHQNGAYPIDFCLSR